MTDKLYVHGFVIADIGHETKDQCQSRMIAALELVKGVYRAERPQHMLGREQPNEINLTLFIEQGADLDALEETVSRIPGVKFQDVTETPVRAPAPDNNPPCGQPGHQCGCPTKTPKP